jgi:hypothetical protein
MSLGLMIDKKTKRFVRPIFPGVLEHVSNPFFSALSLRLFGQDITTVGQQKAKSQNENQDREHQTETPVEHAPILDEDKESTPIIDDEYVPGETENSKT